MANNNLLIKGARIIYKNFEGVGTDYNSPGDRNFCVIIDKELADTLAAEGWNVKVSKPHPEDPDYEPYFFIKVKLSYRDKKTGQLKRYPPELYMINSTGKHLLDENTVKVLDKKRIVNADLLIYPWSYENRQTHDTRIQGYVKELYATIEESELEREYSSYDGPSIDLPFEPD